MTQPPTAPLRGRTGHIAWNLYGDHPTVVLLHGFSDSAACWQPLIPALARHGGLLTVDARGHGHSGLPEEPVGPGPHAGDVAAVLDELNPPEPTTVIGHSMGGATAAMLAATRPDLVSALILEDPPPRMGGGRPDGALPDWLVRARSLDLAGCVAHARTEHPTWPEDELPPWAEAKHQFNPHFCTLPAAEGSDLRDVFAWIACPVLLLQADPDIDGRIDDAEAAELARAAPAGVSTIRFDGTGHNIRREARGRYLRHVHHFITAVG